MEAQSPYLLDLAASLATLAAIAAGALAYGLRLRFAGPAHYARVDAAGSSRLLSRQAMELGYWCLQPAARACVRLGLSPNRLTALSLAVGAAAGVALAFGHVGVAAALAAISALGDALDGLVARTTGRSTPAGALFDAATDRYTETFLLAGLALHFHDSEPRLALALLALLGAYMVSYGSAKAEALGVKAPRGSMRRGERAVYLSAGLLLTPLAAAVAARGHLPLWVGEVPLLAALALVAAVSNVSAVLRLAAIGRAAQEKLAANGQAPVFPLAEGARGARSSARATR